MRLDLTEEKRQLWDLTDQLPMIERFDAETATTLRRILAAIIVLFWMRRHYRQIIAERAESSRLIVLKMGRFLLIIVLVVALLAGVAGITRLARLLAPGIFVGGVLALAAFAYLRVSGGMIALAFRVWPLRLLQM